MKKSKQRLLVILSLLLSVLIVAYWFFASFSTRHESTYVYVDSDDTADSVYAKLETTAQPHTMAGVKLSGMVLGYGKHVRPGRYEVSPSISSLQLMRHLRNGRQTPVRLVIPIVHTMPALAERLSHLLQADSASLAAAFTDSTLLAAHGATVATAPCLFLPNTYEVYWTISPEQLLNRMQRERDAYWTAERKQLAQKAGLTPDEVVTLASIVEQETANNAERPKVAGMYLNRLRKGMKLQADPTVKFALQNFALRRIMHQHLTANSPYNTYRNEGLPPGPICIPSLASIEAVLHFTTHPYIYMCAKEDFSGTHNFAATYTEHLQNAKKYSEALNKRGIK